MDRRSLAAIGSGLLLSLALGACGLDGPRIEADPGVHSSQTAEAVQRLALDRIAESERRLGRSLAPPRILLVKLLAPGETYWAKKLDGTTTDPVGLAPSDGPGWVVEAEGTFVGIDFRTNTIASRGMHGFYEFDDAGGEGRVFYPCWTLVPSPPEGLEGRCP